MRTLSPYIFRKFKIVGHTSLLFKVVKLIFFKTNGGIGWIWIILHMRMKIVHNNSRNYDSYYLYNSYLLFEVLKLIFVDSNREIGWIWIILFLRMTIVIGTSGILFTLWKLILFETTIGIWMKFGWYIIQSMRITIIHNNFRNSDFESWNFACNLI